MSHPDHPSRWEPSDGEAVPAPDPTELVERFLAASATTVPRVPVNVLGPVSDRIAEAIAKVEMQDLWSGVNYLLDQSPAFRELTINQARYRER